MHSPTADSLLISSSPQRSLRSLSMHSQAVMLLKPSILKQLRPSATTHSWSADLKLLISPLLKLSENTPSFPTVSSQALSLAKTQLRSERVPSPTAIPLQQLKTLPPLRLSVITLSLTLLSPRLTLPAQFPSERMLSSRKSLPSLR